MQHPDFKVKIIGGKIVKVPDFDYLKEHNVLGTRLYSNNADRYKSKNSFSNNREMYGIQRQPYVSGISNPERYIGPKSFGGNVNTKDTDYIRRDIMDLTDSRERQRNGYSQQIGNRIEAERNRLNALSQTYQSELEPGTPYRETDQTDLEDEKDNTALAQQVADCLKNTNKQKLGFALRAMQRLDMSETGYITVRQFRDVLLMYQIFIIGGTLEKLIERYKSNGGKINYTKLWTFVTDSLNGRSSSNPAANQKSTKLQQGIQSIEKDLKTYAHRYHETFDFADLINSIKNCDRGRSGVIGMNELRILGRHYLPISDTSLDLILEHCDAEKTGWINYNMFVQILTDAQPTYLPPIKMNRRNTFVLENNDTIMRKLHHTIENNRKIHDYPGNNVIENKRTLEENSRIEYYNNSRKYDNNDPSNKEIELNKGSFVYQENGKPQPNNQNSGETKDLLDRNSRQENLLSPRRKWYESEESWRKRKRRVKPRRQLLRRRWEHSAPVISLRESADLDNDDSGSWHDLSDFSEDETVNAGKFNN